MLDTIKKNYYFYDEFNAEGTEDLTLKEIADRLDIYSESRSFRHVHSALQKNFRRLHHAFVLENFCKLFHFETRRKHIPDRLRKGGGFLK